MDSLFVKHLLAVGMALDKTRSLMFDAGGIDSIKQISCPQNLIPENLTGFKEKITLIENIGVRKPCGCRVEREHLSPMLVFERTVVNPHAQIGFLREIQQPKTLELASCNRKTPGIVVPIEHIERRIRYPKSPLGKLAPIRQGKAEFQQVDRINTKPSKGFHEISHIWKASGEDGHLNRNKREVPFCFGHPAKQAFPDLRRILLLEAKPYLIESACTEAFEIAVGKEVATRIQTEPCSGKPFSCVLEKLERLLLKQERLTARQSDVIELNTADAKVVHVVTP